MFGILCVCFGLISLINAAPEIKDGDLRLLGGSTENEGTVLIYHNGRWGSICDRGWDIRDGNVACHQLGFHRALQTLRYSPFGPGRTLRWLTGLRCRGRERRLDECYPREWGIERDRRYCSGYSRSAAVVCLPHSTTTSTTTPSTTTTTTTIPSTTTTKTTTATTAKQKTQHTKTSVVVGDDVPNGNIISSSRAINGEEHDKGDEDTGTVMERYSNNSIIFDDKGDDDNDDQYDDSDEDDVEDDNDNVIQRAAESTSQPRRSRLQYDAEWSDTRRTRDRDVITTASPLKVTTSTSRPTTTKENSRAAAPAPVGPSRYDEEVYSIRLPSRRWIKDPLLKCWVLLTYREKILIAKPGQRPSRITKEEYYKKRRSEIMKQKGEEDIPNEITRSPLNDASGSHSGSGSNQIEDRGRVPTTTSKRPVTTTTTQKPTTTTKKPTTTTPKPTTTTKKPTTITKKPTTTTQKPTTTTPKPTTKKPTTTTTTTTTPKPTTTTTKKTTITTAAAASAPASAYEDEVFSVELTVGRWIKDKELNMWVMLSRSGGVSVAKPGQRAIKIDEDEYYQMRREAITKARDRLKADDPSVGQVPAPANRQLSFGSEGGTIRSRTDDASASSDIMISSDLNITREHTRDKHYHRNRHGHGSKKIEVRLAGSQSNRGRIEVRSKGRDEWGVICGDHWTIKETMVVCRDMNTGYGQQAIKRAVFGGSNMKKYYSRVRCKGTEKRLEDCEWEEHDRSVQCRNSQSVAGVICTSALPDLEPSIYMLETTTFLQDRHLYYLQCAMEEKCLAPSAYEAQRSRGWRSHTRRLLRFSSVVKNIGTADFQPMSNRDEWEWHACHMHYHSMDVFAHYDILDMNGNRVAEGLKASFCLEDSACNPGVRPKYSCQNYGKQGISVGCSDNYMADIDCQWVDITDLKQGKYIFKVEINPNLIVAEISYDNNVVVCDLNYTGYYARIHNCKHAGLL